MSCTEVWNTSSAACLRSRRFGSGCGTDPRHAVRYEPTAANDQFDVRFTATLPGGEDLLHVTTGAGFVVSRRFEVNLAGDLASKRNTFSMSAIYRF